MSDQDGFLRNLSRLVEPAALTDPIGGSSHSIETASQEAGIVFRLDIKRFATDSIYLGHQVMLVVAAVIPPAKSANVDIRHLVDLGVIEFREGAPERGRKTIARTEIGSLLWTFSDELEHVWQKLEFELCRYLDIWIEPPAVVSRRPLRIAVVGLDYFNEFSLENAVALPHLFVSSQPMPSLF
ncbi:MAG: hypothetical protein MUC50_12720 [Myxococcota bacterium]|jgi:hypothetical protein|nr:hypothetical protein [Myxococcota bacterium]